MFLSFFFGFFVAGAKEEKGCAYGSTVAMGANSILVGSTFTTPPLSSATRAATTVTGVGSPDVSVEGAGATRFAAIAIRGGGCCLGVDGEALADRQRWSSTRSDVGALFFAFTAPADKYRAPIRCTQKGKARTAAPLPPRK